MKDSKDGKDLFGKDLSDVGPADVAEFLEGTGFKVAGAPVRAKDEEAEPDRIEVPADRLYSPENPAADAVMDWVLAASSLGMIPVEDHEKTEFLRAALHNREVSMDVEIMGGVTIRCRSLTDRETDVLFAALRLGKDKDHAQTEVEYYTSMQRYGTCMQIVSIDGEDLGCHRPGDAPMLQEAARLVERAERDADKTAAPRTAMLRAALRVFSVKMKLCTESMLNMDFWPPADAG